MPDFPESSNADDLDLVRRTCDGDLAAAEQLFLVVLGPTLKAIARHWNYEDLPDEFFVHLRENNWRRLRTWKGNASLKGWVRIVATRICSQMVKGSGRPAPLSLGEEFAIPSDEESVLHRLIETESGLGLLAAIEKLDSTRDRLLLRMHYLESKPLADVALMLDCPIDRIYVVKTRAIQRLRQILEGVATHVDASGR